MKRIFDKWEQINIKYKLFVITTSLLIGLAIVIYIILDTLMPPYYHEYKTNILEESIETITKTAPLYDKENLEERLYYLAKEHNIAILVTDSLGRVIYGNNEMILLGYRKYVLKNEDDEYRISVPIKTKESNEVYTLDVIMPLQPIDEASEVIRKLMPYIILVAILIAIIGAYIYSNTITKPLIDIINREREEEIRRKEFVATISHELKTPITIISGQLEGMMYNVGKYKDRDTYLKKSYDSTQELKELVTEMIEVSKAEILEEDICYTKFNISDLLIKSIKRQSFLMDEKNIKTHLQISDNLFINADEEKITKVINNLINNAIKYSPSGEKIIIRLFKSVKINRKNIYGVKLEIENTGVTISEEHIKNVFNQFYRVEKSRSRKTGGSGLGLYIVSRILKKHGFKYNISNKENSVLFTIEFYNN